MKHSKILLFLFLLCSFGNLKSQEDINKQLIEYETADVDHKIALFFFFYNKVREIEKDSILYYVKDLQKVGIKNKREDAIAMANFGLAPYLQENSLYDEAIRKLNKAAEYYKKAENDTMLADTYNALGNTVFLQGKIDKAEMFYTESAKFAKRSGEQKFLMLSVFNMARVNIELERYDDAYSEIDSYVQFLKKNDGSIRMLAAAYGLLGQLYLNQKDYVNAIENFTRSMEYGLTVGSMKTVANGYTNLAIVEFFSENYDRSEQYFQLALAYRLKDNDKYYIAESYYNLGDFYSGVNKMDSALINYQRSVDVGESFNNHIVQKDALLQISGIYETTSKPHLQIEVLKKIIEIQGKINKQQHEKELAALKISYDQSFNEALSIGGVREEELKSKLGSYNSIFNNWILLSIICVLGLTLLFFFIKKKNKG
ncbi:MAG TPA: tetratricopeptide repeat protein [Brumimicrobium sp.]|nr:tetratricopeptide repeat protein [Brumimicrobium sp.]